MTRSIALTLGTAFLAFAVFPALAGSGIEVTNAWARATPPGIDKGAGYLEIHNHGDTLIRLTGATAHNTSAIEIHRSRERNGQMRMEAVEQGLPIAPGESVTLEPMGYHLMLMGLSAPLKAGDHFPLTLEFSNHDNVEASLEVRSPNHDNGDSGHSH